MGEPTPVAAILFDMDGLMLDTERLILWGWQQAMADFGYPASTELYLRSVGVTEERTNGILREALGVTFPVEAVRDREREHVRRYIAAHGVPLKPGLRELLDYLDRRGLRRAVASSAWRRTVEEYVGSVGLLPRFHAIAAGDEVTHGKPAPDVLLLAASRLGVAPASCLVLEDSESGAYAARSAGMAVVVVPDLQAPSHDVAAFVEAILPDLHAVRSWLAQRLPVEHDSSEILVDSAQKAADWLPEH